MGTLGYKNRDAQCEFLFSSRFLGKTLIILSSRVFLVMTVPIYVVAIVISLSLGWNADRTNQKAWHIVGACIMSAISFIICATVKKASVR